MKLIKLCINNLSFDFVINNNCCSIKLFQDNQIKELGFDLTKNVLQNFLSILDTQIFPECNIEYRNRKYVNFLNLSEKHTSMYATQIDNGIEILIQNADNLETIVTICLSSKECQTWKDRLEFFLIDR